MVLAQLQEKYVTYVIIWAVSMFKGGQTYHITSCHGACNSESIAAINTQFFCITVLRAQTDILHKNHICTTCTCSSTFSTGRMVRRQTFDLFVDKSLQLRHLPS